MRYAIEIVHLVSPSLFWYFRHEDENNNTLAVEHLEEILNSELAETSYEKLSLKVGDDVAVYCVSWRRYIRAKVAQATDNSADIFVYWASDYGFPFRSEAEHVRRLPSLVSETTTVTNNLRCGAIADILPAEPYFECDEYGTTTAESTNWSQCAIVAMNNLLDSAAMLLFDEILQLENGQYIGNLTVCTTHLSPTHANEFLIRGNYAIAAAKNCFLNVVTDSFLVECPWLAPDIEVNCSANVEYDIDEHFAAVSQRNFAVKKVNLWCNSNHLLTQSYSEKSSKNNASQEKNVRTVSKLARKLQVACVVGTPPLGNNNSSAVLDDDGDDTAEQLAERTAECEHVYAAGDRVNKNVSSANDKNMDTRKTTGSGSKSQTGEDSQIARLLKRYHACTSISGQCDDYVAEPKACIKLPEDKQKQIPDVKSSTCSELLTDEPDGCRPINRAVLFAKVTVDDEGFIDKKQLPAVNWDDMRSRNHRTSQREVDITNFTVIPAGFDLVRLNKYNDENHWHRSNTTRKDKTTR